MHGRALHGACDQPQPDVRSGARHAPVRAQLEPLAKAPRRERDRPRARGAHALVLRSVPHRADDLEMRGCECPTIGAPTISKAALSCVAATHIVSCSSACHAAKARASLVASDRASAVRLASFSHALVTSITVGDHRLRYRATNCLQPFVGTIAPGCAGLWFPGIADGVSSSQSRDASRWSLDLTATVT